MARRHGYPATWRKLVTDPRNLAKQGLPRKDGRYTQSGIVLLVLLPF